MELKWAHIDTYGELLPNLAIFFWLNLSILLKEFAIWLKTHIYIFWVSSRHIFTFFFEISPDFTIVF